MDKSSVEDVITVNATQKKDLLRILGMDWQNAVSFLPEDLYGEFIRFMIKLLMEAEVSTKCGEKHERIPNRKYVRHGTQTGSIVMQGGRESIEKPRIRSIDKKQEANLETYAALSKRNALDQRVLASILAGVPTRHYAKLLERQLQKNGVSKSSVSRKAIAATKPQVEEFLSRRLENLNLVALMLDGIHVGKRNLIACIGIDTAGRKHLVAVRLGATENMIVCRDLIADMIERGLNPSEKYLFVIDGSKALGQAIRAAFGDNTAIQRCQEHKIRDVEGYLPFKHRKQIRSQMQAAYSAKTESAALKRLQKIRTQLSLISEQAVNSLTEGMRDSVTLHRLGITGLLYKSLRTTNIIESAFSAARRRMKNTVRHRNEASIQGWTIRALLVAEKHFRNLQGHRQIAKLKKNLK